MYNTNLIKIHKVRHRERYLREYVLFTELGLLRLVYRILSLFKESRTADVGRKLTIRSDACSESPLLQPI